MQNRILANVLQTLLATLVLSVSVALPTFSAPPAKPGEKTQAFNPRTGTLDVDYASYLSKHDIVFNRPITSPVHGLTVGNGRVGAMVWNTNGLTMQVSGVDASQQGVFSQGTINLYTNPGMDTGYSKFQQRLSLYDGLVVTKYDSDRTITIMGSPNSEVIGIHVEDRRSKVESVTLDLSLWDVRSLGGGDVPDINTWKTVSTYADDAGIGLSRGQTDANHFGYTLAASVEGARFTTQTVDSNKVRLVIQPASSYTIWIACASRLNAPGHDSVAQAKKLLKTASATGYATILADYKNWWHRFWQKSFVQYSNASGDADYMENVYYLATYMIAAGGYANYPFHFINGAFSAVEDKDSNKWSYGYWYWNQRDVYNSFFASNHIELMDGFNNLYSRNFDALKSHTMTKYGIDGIWVPETMGWDGNARHTDGSDFVKDILSTGTEASMNMYLRYRYTNDATYLRRTAYPFMKEVVKFYAGKLSYNSETGKYSVKHSNAHETYWGVQNAITDLAAVRALFPITIQVSQQLGVDAALRPQWQKILDNLVAYPVAPDGLSYLPHDPPAVPIRNGENVTSELIWPYDVTGIGAPDYSLALTGWRNRPNPYGNIWANDAIQAARLGLGDDTYNGMKGMLAMYQTYPNGRSDNTNGEFEYLGTHLLVINEALLQSYNDKIRIFPALPSDAAFVSKFTLLAKGGFLVSSEKEANEIKYIGIKSLYGNTAIVVNPWGVEAVNVLQVPGNRVLQTTTQGEIRFPTKANTVYILERKAKKQSSYPTRQLTGITNNGAKVLESTSSTLGSFATTPPDTGKYEAENATLVSAAVSSDFAASNVREVTNMAEGSSITFASVVAGEQLAIRYCTFNNPGKLGLYINGTLLQDVVFPPTNSWSGTYATLTINASIPKGASIKLQHNSGHAGVNIDYIQIGTTP